MIGTAVAIRTRALRRAFTMVELMIVILIIGVVVTLVLPALGGVRTTVRKASTRALMSDFSKACDQFQLDQRKQPGYFSARDMGSVENATRGFTVMENMLLDLAGGIVPAGTPVTPSIKRVGPVAGSEVLLDLNRIGLATDGNKGYFVPPIANYVVQNGSDGGDKPSTVWPDHKDLPDLVDSFKSPILAWAEDEAAVGNVANVDDFARVDSTQTSRYYLASNSAFLGTSALGRYRTDQAGGSTLGTGAAAAARIAALAAVLGNPSYHSPFDETQPAPATVYPMASRGKVVLHSAGPDAFFFGTKDKGLKQIGGVLSYDKTFLDPSKPEDVTHGFDDILVSTGN